MQTHNRMVLGKESTGWPVTTMYLNPVERVSVQGRGQYSYIDSLGQAVPMNRSFSKTAGKRYSFPPTIDGMSVKTELSRLVINPWYGLDVDNLPPEKVVSQKWVDTLHQIKDKEQISKQLELEMRFDLDEGMLTNVKNLHFNIKMRGKEDKPNFLETFFIVLYDRANRFTDETLRGALAIELARVSGKIAEKKSIVNINRHDFYISEENEDAIERTAKQDIVNDAITNLTLLRRKHTFFTRYQVGVVLGKVKGTVSESILKDELNKFINTKGKDQMQNIKEFQRLYDMIDEGQKGMDKLQIEYVVKQAINSNVIGISGGNYTWHSKKGVDNLYNLGTKHSNVIKLFTGEFMKYDPDSDQENWYGDLITELRQKSIRISE
jgi:hypothetical protein